MLERIKLEELVHDGEIYPRSAVDSGHVGRLAEAMLAGREMPPIIIDKRTKTIIDGWHRAAAAKRLKWKDIAFAAKEYRNRKDMFRDAMRYNAAHGRTMSPWDRAHCVLIAERLEISVEQIAADLSITVAKVGEIRAGRVGELHVDRPKGKSGVLSIPLKRTISHMAGHELTSAQVQAQDKLGGMQQGFYVNQLIMLIENGLLDTGNPQLMEQLRRLTDLLNTLARRAA